MDWAILAPLTACRGKEFRPELCLEMKRALNNLNAGLIAQASSPASSIGVSPPGATWDGTRLELATGTAALPGYSYFVCSVTADEGDIGRGSCVRDDYSKLWFKSDVSAKRRAATSIKLSSARRVDKISAS